MSKKLKINLDQDLSNIIYKFFDGDINKITKAELTDIYNNPAINIDYKEITEVQFNFLLKKVLRGIKSKKDIRFILKESTLDPEEEIIEDVKKKDDIEFKDTKTLNKFVSFQRKSFVNWINNDFYKEIIDNSKNSKLKIYQNFVKGYLGLNTPFRGLLVYHGLGTGKTATAVSTAEGLSINMDITTILPASLETNFIAEVKQWGEDLFKINNNNWIFIKEKDIINDKDLREKLYENYKITPEIITKIYNKINRLSKDKIEKGFWWISDDPTKDKNEIKTIRGKLIINNKDTDITVDELDDIDEIYIDTQIDILIKLKYNFIHYNPFPEVKDTQFDEFKKEDDKLYVDINTDKEYKTNNQKIVKKLEDKLKNNQKKHYINSPFYNETIIIDEVHNFVREIINNSGPARIFYNWIINSKNIKLICLSGTPTINKPSEIAILFNMIRGITKTYNFTIKTDDSYDTNELYKKLKDIFYHTNSPIYQIQVYKKLGKIIISFMQNTSRFESIMNPDNRVVYTIQYNNHDFKDFINIIYKGLHQIFNEGDINPSQITFDKLDEKDLINIIKGEEVIFDTDIKIKFNIYRKLFTIDYQDTKLDLTDNNLFMSYFYDESGDIPTKKKTLLKRMLIGLTSYYPIDRSSIVNMPEIIIPLDNNYEDYNISKKIKIELCTMSQKQFEKYESSWLSEKEKAIKFNRKNMYSSENFDYHIRTRQACNMIYDNDKFRLINKKKNEAAYTIEKNNEYERLFESKKLVLDNGLHIYSPKFYKLLLNIQKFVKDKIQSTGKILFYSEFRGDAGSEIFELILKANGYSKYDSKVKDDSKKLRYTFITGSESQEERALNRKAFNDIENILGDYIQIMIISGAGAEGISLTCVRQVHILEPYWNYIRVDQVFGRAIRLMSHKDLPPTMRNVEQYLYLSTFPEGDTIDDIYTSLTKLNTWNNLLLNADIGITSEDLANNHKDIFDTIQKIIRIKAESISNTADQTLFDMMERKFNISTKITDIIKESSVDCLQNTRDDFNIHQSCVQFDMKLEDETSFYPGMSSDKLDMTDQKQLKSKFSHFIKPNIYIVSALQTEKQIFLYYKLSKVDIKDTDIRYIRDNGKIIGSLYVEQKKYYKLVNDHILDEKLGSKLSVFEEIYSIDDDIIEDIENNEIFPDISILIKEDNLFGYKIKFNITERFYFYLNDGKPIMRIYDFDTIEEVKFNTTNITPIIVDDKELFEIVE